MKIFLSAFIPFFIILVSGPFLIKKLRKWNASQQIRELGPDSHFEKEGTPTMGGILIISALVISVLILLPLNYYIIWSLVIIIGMGLIGFIDDILKIKKKDSSGLKGSFRISGEILLSFLLALYIYYFAESGSLIILPFFGEINIGIWIIPLIILTVIGTGNAVNITDGLDGLAAGLTVIVIMALSLINFNLGLPSLGILGLIIAGTCLGFLWFNCHPAQIFMGDVGSLALGGAISILAIFSQTQIFLLILGGVFVLETLSVISQVFYFKISGGKRIFNMTPIHHHFELAGFTENKIVVRFWIIGILFAGCGFLLFYLSI